MQNPLFDKIILNFLQANTGAEFQVSDLCEQICTSFRLEHIRQALDRLSKRKLVSRRISGEGKAKHHYWTVKTAAKNTKTQEGAKHGTRQKV